MMLVVAEVADCRQGGEEQVITLQRDQERMTVNKKTRMKSTRERQGFMQIMS